MTEPILFTDVEDAVMTFLGENLPEYVGDRVPTNDQLPGVVVARLGGPQHNVASERATVTVEAWAKDWHTANDLAQRARQQVHSLAGRTVKGTRFSRVDEFAGPGRLPDPVKNLPRVVATYSLTARPNT